MSFCEKWLRDVFRWRGCVIFFIHLLTSLHDFCFEEIACCFFVGRLHFVDKLHIFLCVERLHNFFTHSLIPSLFLEVA